MAVTKNSSTNFDYGLKYILPNGGTTGQVLGKISNSDQDYGLFTVSAPDVSFSPPTGSPLTSTDVASALEELALLAGSGGGGSIATLSDVHYATGDPIYGQLLWYNSSNWTPTSAPTSGYVVQFTTSDGVKWVDPATLPAAALTPSKLRAASTLTNLGTTSGAVTLDMRTDTSFTITPNGDTTINMDSHLVGGGEFTLVIYDFNNPTTHTLTFGTSFRTTGTIALGAVASKVFVIKFICDGFSVFETSRVGPI